MEKVTVLEMIDESRNGNREYRNKLYERFCEFYKNYPESKDLSEEEFEKSIKGMIDMYLVRGFKYEISQYIRVNIKKNA